MPLTDTLRWGDDVTGALRLCVDADHHVREVRVESVPPMLRHRSTLEAAVRAAIADAELTPPVTTAAASQGGLRLHLVPDEGLERLEVDLEWLRTVDAAGLQAALTEALAQV